MDTRKDPCNYGFVLGLVTGAFVGAGLALCLAPRGARSLANASPIRPGASAERASERLHEVNARVGEAVDELSRTGRGFGDEVAGVGRAARAKSNASSRPPQLNRAARPARARVR